MNRTAEKYRDLLLALLPPGRAFSRENGTTIDALLDGMAQELARIDARADELTVEVNPLTTNELLPDWERVAGLPDNCAAELADTVQGRRQALVAKLTGTGGQSRQYFIDVAAALGYTITITEFDLFHVGDPVGLPLYGDDWQFAWQVNAPATTIVDFRVGESTVGEPLRSWGNDDLECKINQLKPAHTVAIFSYA
jgi:uncharacterized protein YmfQ (DUF2313 family)